MSPTRSMIASIDRPITAAASDGRTVTGLALPYGVPGHSSRGRVIVDRGAVALAADLKRIKLYRDHSDASGTPVGYCTSAEDTAEGIVMSFKIGATPDGDAALADVAEGIRDALSVEIMGAELGAGNRLKAGTITAVALVAVPAFEDARVHGFTASLNTDPADDEAPSTGGDDRAAGGSENVGIGGTENTTPEPPEPVAPAADAGAVDNDRDNDATTTPEEDEDMTNETKSKAPEAPEPVAPAAPAAAPVGLTAARTRTPEISFSSVVDALLGAREGAPRNELMTAALADITRSAHPAVASSAWLGELWGGIAYQREIVPTMTPKRLTSMRGTGWRWVTKPTVDDYAGDKAEIPTNTPVTEAVTLTPRRLAGGHDIDRAYFDFNDREFLASYFGAMTESYAIVSDERAAEFLALEAAKNLGPAQSDLLRAAAKARQIIKGARAGEATSFLVNPEDMFALMDLTALDNPAYLELLGVDPSKFITSDAVTAGSVIAYAKPAVEFHELGSAPIRVEAEHIANGGRDAAVFGYYVPFISNPAGIVEVPFGEVAP